MKSIESSDQKDFSELLSIVERLEALSSSEKFTREETMEWSKELVLDLIDHMRNDLELTLTDDVSALYNEMNRENLLARVENVKRVIECLTQGAPITVGAGDANYANSVTSDLEGLRIAMSEAEVFGPVRLMVGLDLKALVGFTNDHVEVSEIDDNEFDLRDTTLRKAYCRHLDGAIHKDDIRYIVMRIPRAVFPVKYLNDIEKKQPTSFIFRGAKLEVAQRHEQVEEAA